MATFSYTARNKEGAPASGELEAPSREAAGSALRAQGLLPTSIVQKGRRGFDFKIDLSLLFRHVSLLEKMTFINNLAVTLKAGLPLARALGVLSVQMPNPYFREAVRTLKTDVEGGKTLSESMLRFPRVFSPMVASMVKAGEEGGTLDQNLEYLGGQISRDYHLLRRTRGALIYPAVILFTLLVIGYIMFTFVLPRLVATFQELHTELPVLTRAIIGTVDLFSRHPFLLASILPTLLILLALLARTGSGREVLHKLNLALPVTGKIVKKLNMARFTMIFGNLLRSGMPIVAALRITSNTMTNLRYRRALADASEKVKIGVDLVAALEKYPDLFAPMVTQMIRVGEESGTMEKVLGSVAAFYEAEVDETVKNLSSIIEPVLVILIGAVVGVLAVGLILPIYNIGQSI